MATVFFSTPISVSDAKGNRILAAYGKKLNEDGSPATIAQVEGYLKSMIASYVENVELRAAQAAITSPAIAI